MLDMNSFIVVKITAVQRLLFIWLMLEVYLHFAAIFCATFSSTDLLCISCNACRSVLLPYGMQLLNQIPSSAY